MEPKTRFWLGVAVVVVVGIGSAGGYYVITSGESTTPPLSTASFEVNAESGVVTVTHVSGDTLYPGENRVTVETSAGTYEITTDDVGEEFVPGDTVRTDLPARDGMGVEVVWRNEETDARSVLYGTELNVTATDG